MFSKKNKKKGFTLIEMLIVIVIIGILAAALIPKLSSARGRANDVARKAWLSQIAAALVVYQIDKWSYPTTAGSLSGITNELLSAGMASILKDPDTSRSFTGIANTTISNWQYGYTPIKKSWIAANGFVLMAATETEGWSNWVTSSMINDQIDYSNIKLCERFTTTTSTPTNDNNGNCTYNKNADQLRYIYIY